MPPGDAGREPTELHTAPLISGRALVIAWLVLAWAPILCVRAVLTTEQPLDEIIQLLAVSAMGVFLLGWLTHSWLEHRIYGVSVCRLPAAPIVIGEPFDLEIECAWLPGAGAPIVARLVNKAPQRKTARLIWQTEQRIDPGLATPRGAGRSAFPVRLCLPERAGSGPLWVLELRRKAPGVDFRAEFVLPVDDAAHARENEPRPAR